jgi:ABC-type transporter Mla subunit MlaD
MHALNIKEDAAGEPEGADRQALQAILSKLAQEASTLGIDLVDIAGAIQDMAAMSWRHASAFDDVTRTALSIAETNRSVAISLRETDRTAAEARHMLKESAVRLSGSVEEIGHMVRSSQEISTEISTFSKSLSDVDKVAEEISVIWLPADPQSEILAAATAGRRGLEHSQLPQSPHLQRSRRPCRRTQHGTFPRSDLSSRHGRRSFVMMKDISAPITVRGWHWGGLRLAVKV